MLLPIGFGLWHLTGLAKIGLAFGIWYLALALGFGQQPAQFKARIALQFLLLGAPPIREQFKAVVIPPSSEHQGSNPWTPIRANPCQL